MEPALDTRALLRWFVFNLLAGNADGHAKNLQISGKDWRALATSIRVGRILEDTVLEFVEDIPAKARQLSRDLETEYGGMGIADSIAAKIVTRARRTKRLLTT